MLVCVPASLPDALVRSLRDLFAGAPTVDAVLDLLTAQGLAATPAFLCAAVGPEGVRVVVRGDLEAVAHGLDGSSLSLGAGRSASWNDDVVTDIASIEVDVDGAGGSLEWIATTGAAAPPGPAVSTPSRTTSGAPAPSTSSHTLGELDFLRLVGGDEPEPDPEAHPEPEPEPAAEPEAAPADPALGASPGDEPDFSSLLDRTGHGAVDPAPPDRTEAPVPTSAPPPPAPPAPALSPDPTSVLPAGVVPPRPGGRASISAVPASTGEAARPADPPVPAQTATGLGEHDGRTVTLADLRRLQEQAGAAAPAPPVPDAAPVRSSEVRAVRCPVGHANPPTSTTCRLCGAGIADTSVVAVPRPVVVRLVFDSGLVVDVDRPQLIGRRPTVPAGTDELPNLITLPSPDSDISRVHTAVRVEGWDVLVEDLGSTNGTEVRLPGRDPVRLREHDPVLVVVGTEITLAGTVQFTVEAAEP